MLAIGRIAIGLLLILIFPCPLKRQKIELYRYHKQSFGTISILNLVKLQQVKLLEKSKSEGYRIVQNPKAVVVAAQHT